MPFPRDLVDAYQDIEPAQALLIGLLAAPHDSLFRVGDEDHASTPGGAQPYSA